MTVDLDVERPAPIRAYGYTADGRVDEEEAMVIRQVAERVLAGKAISAEATRLNSLGLTGPAGGRWHASTLSRLLVAPRLVGDRPAVRGGTPAAILDRKTYQALIRQTVARRATPAGAGRPQESDAALLTVSGILTCGRCGTPMTLGGAAARRVYRCPSGRLAPKGKPSCGRVAAGQDGMETYVGAAALTAWAGTDRDERAALAAAESPIALALRAELDELIEAAGRLLRSRQDAFLTAHEYDVARRRVDGRRIARTKRLESLAERTRLVPVDEPDGGWDAWWAAAPLLDRQSLVAAVYDRIAVGPANGRPGGGIDPSRLTFTRRPVPALAAA